MNDIDRWLDGIAAADARRPRLESSILEGRLRRYVMYRLRFVILGRAVALAVHIAEFLVLARLATGADLLVGVTVSNIVGLAGAFWWGVLEVLREQIREERLVASHLGHEVGRWMGRAGRLGLIALAAGVIGTAVARWRVGGVPTVLDGYVLAVLIRFALDVWVRTYYSGIYARRRVYRPMVAVVGIELVGFVALLAGAATLGAWALPAVLVLTAVASRGLLYVYTSRAYESLRYPRPRTNWRRAWRGLSRPIVQRAALAGSATAATRVGSIIVLTAVASGMGAHADFIYIFHLLVPLLTTAGTWAQVFYLDFIRVDRPGSGKMRTTLRRGLVRAGVVAGVAAWLVAVAVVVFLGGQTPRVDLLGGLLLLMLAQAQLGRLQLEYFARGQWLRVTLGSMVVAALGLLAGAPLVASVVGDAGRTVAIVVAITAGTLAIRWMRLRDERRVRTDPVAWSHYTWLENLCRHPGAIQVGRMTLNARRVRQVREVADRLAAALIGRGARPGQVAVFGNRHVVWFADADKSLDDTQLVRLSAGLTAQLVTDREDSGVEATRAFGTRDRWAAPLPAPVAMDSPLADIAAEPAVGIIEVAPAGRKRRRPPSLDRETIDDLWRQALITSRGGRRPSSTGWTGIGLLESTDISAIVAIGPTATPEQRQTIRERIRVYNWHQLVRKNGGAIPKDRAV